MINIEELKIDHLNEIIPIEKESFTANPWKYHMFLDAISNDINQGFVIKYENNVIGYIIVQAVKMEVSILNLAVKTEYRRKGYGRMLLKCVVDYYRSKKKDFIFLEVRTSNTRAQLLYKAMGFIQVGIRKQYYENKEDALVLMLKL